MRIVDRRQNPKGKNLGNRQRFIRRSREQLRREVARRVGDRSIQDTTSGQDVRVKDDGVHEPSFSRDPNTGQQERVIPGNDRFQTGDEIPKDPSGGVGKGSDASEDGEGEDDFVFSMTRDEFLDVLFENLGLPDMVKEKLATENVTKPQRAGFATSGPPARMSMERTMRNSLGRRVALGRPTQAAIDAMEDELARLENGEITPSDGRDAQTRIDEIKEQLARAKDKRAKVPYIDPMDLRFRRNEHRPQPVAQAVMFCLMDVSASMDQHKKAMAKQFFLLLKLFLERQYDRIDVRFIRHTHMAEEVDEETFFYGQKTGGTIVSSSLKETMRIIDSEYPVSDWNVYVAQVSDGDDVPDDVETCTRLLQEQVLPTVQYMAYLELGEDEDGPGFMIRGNDTSDLWEGYERVAAQDPRLAMTEADKPNQIYPVFAKLFDKSGQQQAA